MLFAICRWLVEEEDVEAIGGGRWVQQQAFIEAIGVAIATIAQVTVVAATMAQTSTTGNQGGSSNLQRFKAHHYPTFRGGEDPMVADHWFHQVEKNYGSNGDHL